MSDECRYKASFHIPSCTAEKCKNLLDRAKKYKQEKLRIKTRNELYMELRGYMVVWINSILKSWGKYEDPGEVLSTSWTAFIYCFDTYKPGYTVQGHFYTYTRYYLLENYAKKENVHICIDDLKDILLEFPTPENQQFERLLTLYQFRDVIPKACLGIWDDAMLCLNGSCHGMVRHKPLRFSLNAYYDTRNSYINIIKLILGIKQSMNSKEGK